MTDHPIPTRRTIVRAGAMGLASAATLAGCGLRPTDSGAQSDAAGNAGSTAGSTAGSNGDSNGATDTGITLAAVPVGGFLPATGATGKPVIIAQPEQGKVLAFSAVCTHMGCQVVPQGDKLVCPCHGSQFDGLTGQVLNGPAGKPLPAVAVRLDGQRITPA